MARNAELTAFLTAPEFSWDLDEEFRSLFVPVAESWKAGSSASIAHNLALVGRIPSDSVSFSTDWPLKFGEYKAVLSKLGSGI